MDKVQLLIFLFTNSKIVRMLRPWLFSFAPLAVWAHPTSYAVGTMDSYAGG